MMSNSQTLIDKLWSAHEIVRREDGASLLWVDRHYVHEGSFHAFSQMKARGRQCRRADTHLRRRRSLRADPRPRHGDRQSRDRGAWCATSRRTPASNHITLFGLRRSAPGHRACGRPRAGTDPARPADRLRRQPHLDARRVRRLCVRHRRVRSRARADDADALAEEAEAHAHHRRRQARRRASPPRTSRSRSSRGSAPTARRATPSNLPAARSARCRWKAG